MVLRGNELYEDLSLGPLLLEPCELHLALDEREPQQDIIFVKGQLDVSCILNRAFLVFPILPVIVDGGHGCRGFL